jgi:hypothetical protein
MWDCVTSDVLHLFLIAGVSQDDEDDKNKSKNDVHMQAEVHGWQQ